jgi:hypothetical protein
MQCNVKALNPACDVQATHFGVYIMSNATYNGWTNYATWRVNLEMFDGTEDYWSPESAREFVEEIIESTTPEGVARDYALAFLSDVNWHEISEHTLDNLESEEA